jgi:hypothetical protein
LDLRPTIMAFLEIGSEVMRLAAAKGAPIIWVKH